ncbi:hypothetical protein ISU07_04330 [Nocardioides islandensis]|uniref:Secreted protein n=1 Tax=Nocardioides islandensis TaxID=433663 RepID=A0A930YD41_9ACTN|nr:hypothetical protein [Nocardioides islandensis]MBF4762342.1 hypothetical protein [Nocardioides islandensis]
MRIIVPSLAVAAGLVLLAAPSHATPATGGCPTGNPRFALFDVATEPYAVDNAVDAKGNNDGWVCALPLYTVLDENGNELPYYNFIDNVVPLK